MTPRELEKLHESGFSGEAAKMLAGRMRETEVKTEVRYSSDVSLILDAVQNKEGAGGRPVTGTDGMSDSGTRSNVSLILDAVQRTRKALAGGR